MAQAQRNMRSVREAGEASDNVRVEKDHRSHSSGVGRMGLLGRGATGRDKGDSRARESTLPLGSDK